MARPMPWWMGRDPKSGPSAPAMPNPAVAPIFVVGDQVRLKAAPDRLRRVLEVVWHYMRHEYVYVVETTSGTGRAYWFQEQLVTDR